MKFKCSSFEKEHLIKLMLMAPLQRSLSYTFIHPCRNCMQSARKGSFCVWRCAFCISNGVRVRMSRPCPWCGHYQSMHVASWMPTKASSQWYLPGWQSSSLKQHDLQYLLSFLFVCVCVFCSVPKCVFRFLQHILILILFFGGKTMNNHIRPHQKIFLFPGGRHWLAKVEEDRVGRSVQNFFWSLKFWP